MLYSELPDYPELPHYDYSNYRHYSIVNSNTYSVQTDEVIQRFELVLSETKGQLSIEQATSARYEPCQNVVPQCIIPLSKQLTATKHILLKSPPAHRENGDSLPESPGLYTWV